MQTEIGSYDPATRQVPVSFTVGELVHKRAVNACLKNGEFDPAATADRVAQVARGVAVKMDLGVITEQPEPEALPAAAEVPAEPVETADTTAPAE